MSLLFKRKGSPYWYVTKTRESTGTINRKLAEGYARKALTEHWRAETLGEKTHTWADLVADWLDRKDGMASFEQDRMVIEKFSVQLERHKLSLLTAITGDELSQYGKTVKALHSPATANRHFTTLRAMLNHAYEKDPQWIDRVPVIRNYDLVKREPRWLTPEQTAAILAHLPDWVADMFVVAGQTGMRFSNVAGLRWDWVSPDGNTIIVPAVAAKTQDTYTVPLSDVAKKILAKRLDVQPQSPKEFQDYVFVGVKRTKASYIPCAPITSVRYWWETAVEKSGVPYLNWHAATRHTFASWHTQHGTPDRVLKALGGWASTRMLENYAHLSTAHLTQYANNLNASAAKLTGGNDANSN